MAERRFQFMAPEAQRVQVQSSPEQRVRPASQLRGTVQGGGVGAPTPVRASFDRSAAQFDSSTLDALRAMGDALIDPIVQRRQEELFYEGARKQIEGEKLQDIVQEQPWYSKIFGPSASVQGARTMAQMQAVESFATNMQRDMSHLRTLSGDEFQQEVMRRISEVAELGDTATNVAVQSQLLESMAPLIRNHTAEHFSWVQEQMQEQFTGTLVSNARFMQSAVQGLATGRMSEEDYRQVQANTAMSLQPIEGQTPESYWAGVQVATEEAMASGNFHFVNVVEATLYEHMPAEQRVKFLNDRRKYEIQTAADMAVGEFSIDIAQLRAYSSEGQISPQGTWDRINEINRRFRAKTGLSRDLIDASSAEGILTNNLRGIISEQRKAAEAAQSRADRLAELAAQTHYAQVAFMGGFANSYVAQGGDRQLTQDAAWGAIQGMQALEGEGLKPEGSWAEVAAQALNNDGFKVTQLEHTVQRGIRSSIGGDYNPVFEQSYQAWRQLYEAPGGENAAAAYAGEYAGQMEQYHRDRLSGFEDPAVAFAANFRTAPSRTPAGQDQTKELFGWLQDNHTNPGVFSRIMGASQPLNQSGQAVVAAAVADSVAALDRNLIGLSQEARFGRGFASARERLDIVGEHAYLRNPSDIRVKDFLSVTDEEAGLIFNDVIQQHSRAVGVRSPESFQIIRLRDVGRGDERQPAFVVRVYDDDGVPATFNFTGEELRSRIGQRFNVREEDTRTNFGNNPIPGL